MTMIDFFRAALNKALPSWTVWAGVLLAVLSGLPDVLTVVVGWFGDVTPELTARVVAVTLVLTRLRSIVAPLLKDLLAKPE
jgi:membrane protein YqaA with SNARE-associated domain